MDPLSITTGVITILQATSTIITICYNYHAAMKDAPWSLKSIINELKGLRSVLEKLEELTWDADTPKGLQSKPALVLLQDTEHGPLATCLEEVRTVESILKPTTYTQVTNSKVKAALQAVRWQLKERDVEECLKRIERCKSTLSLILSADQSAVMLKIIDTTSLIQDTAQSMDYKITVIQDELEDRKADEEHNALLKWLSPVDPYEKHESATSTHHEGTGTWIYESKEFKEWNTAKSSFLWLSGIPGSGKTILFSDVVAHTTQTAPSGAAIAYFYCDFTRSDFQSAHNVIMSLVAQLCSQYPYPNELIQAYRDSLKPGQRSRPSWDILGRTLSWFTQKRKIFLLIDALDECEQRDAVLRLFRSLHEKQAKMSVFITGRAENDIEQAFEGLPRLRLENRQMEVERDIATYIDQRLAGDEGLKKLTTKIKTDIKISLTVRCTGMFRWAQCQLDELSRARTSKAIRDKLKQLPQGLNETYKTILKRVDKDDMEILRRALLWIVFSVMPLTLTELQEAIAIDASAETLEEIEESRLSDPNDILSMAGSLLHVSESGHVTLAHLSVQEYLLSAELNNDAHVSAFAFAIEEAHHELAITCLAYLSLDSLATGPAETAEEWKARIGNQTLLRHVSKAWSYYFRRAKPSDELNETVARFFDNASSGTFMSWIQILNSNWIFSWDKYPRQATPLYYAASFGLEDAVQRLLKKGHDVNAPGSRFGGTALHGATLREHISIMKMLLKSGADPSKADDNRVTPLHTAVRIGNANIIRLLLEHNASKTAPDKLGETPYDWAMKSQRLISQKLLRGEECEYLEAVVNGNESSVYERTPAFFPAMAVAQGLPIPA